MLLPCGTAQEALLHFAEKFPHEHALRVSGNLYLLEHEVLIAMTSCKKDSNYHKGKESLHSHCMDKNNAASNLECSVLQMKELPCLTDSPSL